jgi:hypothetical protein
MSKLGVHVSSGDRRGFGDYLRISAEAGSPVPVIFSVGQDVMPDVLKYSPSTVVIFRAQNDDQGNEWGDGPGSMYTGDPEQAARDWMAAMMPIWARNPAHYYTPLNEQDPATLEGFRWINAFTIECLKIAEANGYKLALHAFSAGNPKTVDNPSIGAPYSRYDAWRELLPSLQLAKANGHILLLHEYGLSFATMRESAPHLALRYRGSYRYLRQHNADPLLVISEASTGVGFQGNDPQIWLQDVEWYDSELMKDRCVIGCCLYQLGGDENLRDMLPALTDYISVTKTPDPAQQADPVVPGPDCTPAGVPVPESMPPVDGETLAPAPVPAPQPEPAPESEPTPTPQPTPEPIPVPEPTPRPSAGPLDFNVVIASLRADPDRPDNVIVTFRIEATGGSGEYEYSCEGAPVGGSTRDRPSARSGAIVETYRVMSSDGQSVEKKFFFHSRDFPPTA